MRQRFELTVNGTVRSVDVEPDTSLLEVLRNELGLVGTRFGCGVGACGACFVLVGGRAVSSCDLPMWSAEGADVTTVEGLMDDGELHAVQRAFLAEQAAQCGYCTSGLLVSAAALLAENPTPDEATVVAALDRNLCRCGVHDRVVRAVTRAGRTHD